MLGTLGSLLNDASRSEVSFDLRLRLSLPDLGADAVEAGTDWPAEISLEPLSELEGFDEEKRRWWPRKATGADMQTALAAENTRAARPAWGTEEAATRRTEALNIFRVETKRQKYSQGDSLGRCGVTRAMKSWRTRLTRCRKGCTPQSGKMAARTGANERGWP